MTKNWTRLEWRALAFAFFLALPHVTSAAESSTEIEVKTAPAALYVCVRRELLPPDVAAFQAEAIALLEKTLTTAKLERIGPLHFMGPRWNGADRPSVFVVGYPVKAEQPVAAPVFFLHAPSFRAATLVHTGPASSLPALWEDLLAEAGRRGLKGSGAWREVFHRLDTLESAETQTELQLALD